jgi:D-alanine-D-alanine ligase
MDIGLAYNLRSDFAARPDGPEDQLEEYDSDATVAAIEAALRELGHAPRRLGGGRRFLEAILARPPELVFNIAEGFGTRSREAHVPAVLEMLGIPFTHSDPLTLALTLDKGMTKRVISAAGLPTPPFEVLEDGAQPAALGLRFPVMAKPLYEGSSIGIRNASRLDNIKQVAACATQLRQAYQQPVLIEEFCPGPEFTVGIVGTGAQARVVGVMEIVPRTRPLDEFVYGLEAKRNYLTEVEYQVPPRRPLELLRSIERVALGAYRALGCRDVARVDLRVARDGEPKFLEVNPLPGLHPVTSDLVILSQRVGWPYGQLIGEVVSSARARHGNR